MTSAAVSEAAADTVMRSCIQKVATGPEFSKDLPFADAYAAMRQILEGRADPVQAAVLLIALRMKRETHVENAAVLQAILDTMQGVTAEVDEVIDVADPYDGFSRGLPVSPFLPAIFAAGGIPAVCHGLEAVGPKYGVTHRKVLRAAGIPVDRSPAEAANCVANPDIGWSYVDQQAFAPALHDLIPLRSRIVKRQLLTTVEVLTGPVRGRARTHLMTGYVHKAYPPIYAALARTSGYDSAAIIRGVEGGVIPSLKQPARIFCYHGAAAEQPLDCLPDSIGIVQATRAVPLPAALQPDTDADGAAAAGMDREAVARAAANAGLEALQGAPGPARDSLVYAAAIMLQHLGKHESLQEAARAARSVLDNGAAMARFDAARNCH
jgi:anthranilate phosphoribosyltransferase